MRAPARLFSARPAPTPLPSGAWQRSRSTWLATGAFEDPGAGAVATHEATVATARAARALRAASAKPVRIREASVLAALRDPSRLIEFSRPMPLPDTRRLVCMLWEEEVASARAGATPSPIRVPPIPPRL